MAMSQDRIITKMHNVFIEARKNGNRGAIKKEFASTYGCDGIYFAEYENTVEQLYNAVHDYVMAKNDYTATDKELEAMEETIFAKWRELLDCGEESTAERKMRMRRADLSNIVTFGQKFVADRNNIDDVEKFVAEKKWAAIPLNKFRQSVETEIGIRLAEVAPMTDADRDFLASERKFLSIIRKSKKRIEALEAEKAKWETIRKKGGKAVQAECDEELKTIDEKITALTSKGAEANKNLVALRNGEKKNA